MRAETHTDVYRPFQGELLRHPMRPLVLARSALRLGLRKKLPAFFLLIPPVLTGIIGAVRVYLLYSWSDMAGEQGGGTQGERAAAAIEGLLGNVAFNVVNFLNVSAFFALLAMTWYGAGMISDDKRLGANLLYFSRPLTRGQYMLGKLLGVGFFGVLTLMAPAALILVVASFASPEWSFLTDRWDVILESLVYCATWIVVVGSLVLGISSLVRKKSLALVLVFGVVILLHGFATSAAQAADLPVLRLCSLFVNFEVFADWLFGQGVHADWGVEASLWVLGATVLGSLLLLDRNVRKMEVVA